MALTWDFNKKIGKLLVGETRGEEIVFFEMNIYRGNALMIFLYEYEKDGEQLYQMYNFFCDKDHAKNCLKNCPEIFRDWLKIELWDYNKNDLWLVSELALKHHIEVVLKQR